jgi:hypothetical protein
VSRYLREHGGTSFYPSRRVYAALQSRGQIPDNIVLDRSRADRFLIMTTDLGRWRGIGWHAFEQVTGPHDVNLDYYIDWRGDARVFATDPETAARLGFAAPADTAGR